MPPVGQYVFAEMLRKAVTYHRREASMPPLLHGRTVSRYLTFKQQFIVPFDNMDIFYRFST